MPFGQPPSSCGIYLGANPDYQFHQSEAPPKAIIPLKGKLFGKEAEWRIWSTANEVTSETIVPYPKGGGMAVHVFCTAGGLVELKALRAVAETLRVEEPKR